MFMVFIVSTILMAFTFVQWFHTVPVFLKTEWGFDERVYGMLMGISSLIIVLIEMPLIHSIEENGQKRKALRWGLILLGGSFVSFLFPAGILFCIVAMLFFTIGEILYLPLNNSFSLLLSTDDRRGEYMSWYWMSWSVANILGPSFGFLIAANFGYDFFWGFLVLLLSISYILNYRVHA
jgi:MFS family permease